MPPLPKSSYVVLGLLSFGERSGYELKQIADNSVGYFYGSPARSQVYSALRRLAEMGYAIEREVEQDDRPDKRLYTITEAGMGALHEWLEESPTADDVIKCHLLLKVFLGRHMGRQTLIDELERYRRRHEEFIGEMERIRENCHGRPGTLFTFLTTGLGLAHARSTVEWIGEAIRLIEQADEQYTWDSGKQASERAAK